MNINKFLFVLALLFLASCQPKNPNSTNSNGIYQCMTANIQLAGKPTTILVEWNMQTGEARFLDSAVLNSKATGTQTVLLGWMPLKELTQVIQEVLQRDQQQQQQRTLPPPPLSLSNAVAEPSPSPENHSLKQKK